LNKPNRHIVVFEHETLRFDRGEPGITRAQFAALEKYHGNGAPFFSLCYNGVKFNEHVGVIQIGNTIIEVLPKADKYDTSDDKWRQLLIGMLQAVGHFDIKATSNSNLRIKPNSILDLYFELFVKEVEYLLHNGLVKQYRKKQGNLAALKGSLQFAKHLQQNLVHKERFYTWHSTYDAAHVLHKILYKTILLLQQINIQAGLHSRIASLLLSFPEMPDMKITAAVFEKIVFTRKTGTYKKAIDIAKLLWLQYHPDVSRGGNDVLALMFDMNALWEKFVYVSLRNHKPAGIHVSAQTPKYFWKPEQGQRSKLIPDIIVKTDAGDTLVLDTKWKNLYGGNPSPDDLRQMYVYHQYFGASKVALVYPGVVENRAKGVYVNPDTGLDGNMECSVITLPVINDIKAWQQQIAKCLIHDRIR
jgi:5-methylcytosine-specific restriction enzyme subunit McrC